LVKHEGRQPAQSGFVVDVTHVPLQQCAPAEQLFPSAMHGVWQAVAGAHSMSPVLFKSVQQPLEQSVFVLHGV
jgi:hypothetical protein